jgi:hypothetical protein
MTMGRDTSWLFEKTLVDEAAAGHGMPCPPQSLRPQNSSRRGQAAHSSVVLLPFAAQVDPQLLALFVEVAALEP